MYVYIYIYIHRGGHGLDGQLLHPDAPAGRGGAVLKHVCVCVYASRRKHYHL